MHTLLFCPIATSRKRRISQKLIKTHFLKLECEQSIIEHIKLNNQDINKALVYGFADFKAEDLRAKKIDYILEPIEEAIVITDHYNLIISFLSLHCVNNIDALITKYKNALLPGGLLVINLFGGKTFAELRDPLMKLDEKYFNGLVSRLMPKIDIKDAARLMQKVGLKNPVSDSEEITIRYSSLANLFYDIKALGLGNVLVERNIHYLGKDYLNELSKLLFDAGKFELTYELITIQGWKI